MKIHSERDELFPYSSLSSETIDTQRKSLQKDSHLSALLMVNLLFERPTSQQKFLDVLSDIRSKSAGGHPLRRLCEDVSERILGTDEANLPIKSYIDQVASLGLDEVAFLPAGSRNRGFSNSWYIGETLVNPRVSEINFPESLMECVRQRAIAVAQIVNNSAFLIESSENLRRAKAPISHLHPDPAAARVGQCLFPLLHIFEMEVIGPCVSESLGIQRQTEKYSSIDGMTTVAATSVSRLFNAYLIGALRTIDDSVFAEPAYFNRIMRSLENLKPVTGSSYSGKFGDIGEKLGILLDRAERIKKAILGDIYESRLRSLLKECGEKKMECTQNPRLADITTPRGSFMLVKEDELSGGISAGLSSYSHDADMPKKMLVIIQSKKSVTSSSQEKKSYEFFTEREGGFAPMASLGISSMDRAHYLESGDFSMDTYINHLHSSLEMRLIDFWNNFPTVMACLSDLGGPFIYAREGEYRIETSEKDVSHFELCLTEDCRESGWEFEKTGENVIRIFKSDVLPSNAPSLNGGVDLGEMPHALTVESEGEPFDPISQLKGERKLAAESLRALGDFPEVFKILRQNFDVRLDCSRGAGSHYMLFREGYAFTLGSKMYKRNEPFNVTIGLKMLKALNISFDEFSSILES